MKIISTIFYTIFVTMIVGIAGLLLGTMLPIPGNIEMKIVKSGSMEPNIPTGSIVVVKPQSDYAIGDVITFGADTKTEIPTTHRIVEKSGENGSIVYHTKGDANEEADTNTTARRDVIGKVVLHIPYIGFVLDFARQPIGFTLLIAIPAALIILEEMLTIANETRKWWRGRNNRDGKGGTPVARESLGTHLKRVYVRRRAMDEIFVARHVPRSRVAAYLHSDAYGTATTLVLGLIFTSTLFSGASGGTLSYFQDIERSVDNIFAAGIWSEEEEVATEPERFATAAITALTDGEVLGVTDESASSTPPTDATSTPPVAPEETPTAPTENPEPVIDEVAAEDPAPATEGPVAAPEE